MLWRLLDPRRGWVAFTFLSHKVLRWLCPFFLLGALVANCPAARTSRSTGDLLLAQVAFYCLAAGRPSLPARPRLLKPLRLTTMFTGMNAGPAGRLLPLAARAASGGAWQRTAAAGRGRREPSANATIRDSSLHSPAVRLGAWSAWRADSARPGPLAACPTCVQTPPAARARRRDEPVHLLLCVADHYEPQLGEAPPEVARARVERWVEDYPRLFGGFRDSDGRPPRHTFFYPARGVRARVPRRPGRAVPRRLRRGRGPPAPRQRHGREPAAHAARTFKQTAGRAARPAGPRPRRPASWPTASSTATGRWTTRGPTAAGAASTTSWTCCARRAATPTSRCPRPRARRRRGRSTASTTRPTTPAGPSRTTRGVDVGHGARPRRAR